MKFTTPQQVFAHIISIYEKCETLDEISKISNVWLCGAVQIICENNDELSGDCKKIIYSNFNLVNSDLRFNDAFLLNKHKAIAENRRKRIHTNQNRLLKTVD